MPHCVARSLGKSSKIQTTKDFLCRMTKKYVKRLAGFMYYG